MDWYLLQTKPNSHSTACDHLRRQGFDLFLPMIIKTTERNDIFLVVKAPLFPGYLFMGTSINPVPWKSVNGTRGVSTAVTLDGAYRPIDTDIIESQQRRCNDDDIIQNLNDFLKLFDTLMFLI